MQDEAVEKLVPFPWLLLGNPVDPRWGQKEKAKSLHPPQSQAWE